MRAASFADVLDEALRLEMTDAAGFDAARPKPAAALPYVPHPFLFARPLTGSAPRWLSPPDLSPVRPDHPLTDDQRQALHRLIDLGASLAANFTAAELRREYRLLAFRYHPDRHAEAGDLERASLGRAFAAATADYRRLRAIVEPRH